MRYTVYVNIAPKEALLDPQGKATQHGLHTLGYSSVLNVRIGKRIRLDIEAPTAEAAEQLAEQAAQKLLCNKIMEDYTLEPALQLA